MIATASYNVNNNIFDSQQIMIETYNEDKTQKDNV